MNSTIERMRAEAIRRSQIDEDLQRPGSSRQAAALNQFDTSASFELGVGYGQTHGFVPNSDEFRRIRNLPRTGWSEDIDAFEQFRRGSMQLRPIQAATLAALRDYGGAFGAIGVGEGKTLISWLAGPVSGARSVLVLVPAKLREKTHREFFILEQHWQGPDSYEVLSYEMLSRAPAEGEKPPLERISPDLIVADEAHRLKNARSACTRRLVRYLVENPSCRFLPMSGTVTNRSLTDFSHLLILAIGREKAPLPAVKKEIQIWARAVDEKVESRARPGALRDFAKKSEGLTLQDVREGVRARIFETPGVLQTTEKNIEASIHANLVRPKIGSACKRAIRMLFEDKISPTGDDALPSDVYRHLRTLALGFFYQWDPEPPQEWRLARKRWCRFVSDILDAEDPRYDSELQIAQACSRHGNMITSALFRTGQDPMELFESRLGHSLDSSSAYEDWVSVRRTYQISSAPVWITTRVLKQVLTKIKKPTIIWVEHQAVGEKLSEISELPYYRQQGLDLHGNFIDDHPASESMIASIQANSEGRNLQAWSRNVVMPPPANGASWQQLLGRTHRSGQTADEIEVDIIVPHREIRRHVKQAVDDARYIEALTGNPQKLLLTGLSATFKPKSKRKKK